MAKRISFLKRIRRETYRIFDQVLDVGNAVIEKTGVEKILIAVSGGGSLGVSTSSGPSGGNNIHYRPPNSTSSIGLGISNGGNASLFVDNQVAMPLTTPHANFIEHPPEKVNHVIADRNQALSEIYGPGYVPESGFETIGVVAVGTAAKQLVQDGIEFASTAINVWGDAHASIYSASDTHRLEALHRNQDRFEKVGQAISHAAQNPGAIVTHYETKVQQAANSFTAAHKHGDMVGAGKAAGEILADVYTISTLGTGVAKITVKATSSAAKATSSFVKAHDFRAPMTFQYDGSRLNSGIPLDVIKPRNPVVPKASTANLPTDTLSDMGKFAPTVSRELTISDIVRVDELTETIYRQIRENPIDIKIIAKNTGLSELRVQRIKDHLFFKKHQLRYSMEVFDADPLIAESWKRLESGAFTKKDIQLLNHELFESKFEGIFKTDYLTSHNAANRAGYLSPIEELSAEQISEIYNGFLYRFR